MTNPINIGSRRELFVDDHLIETQSDAAALLLHHPVSREISLQLDQPWEGNMCGHITVFREEDRYRMYYRGWELDMYQKVTEGDGAFETHKLCNCLAESTDGIHWSRPELGLVEKGGSKANNIVWEGAGEEQRGSHGFAPFKDANPAADPAFRYKAVGAIRPATKGDLYASGSPDGIHWSLLQEDPILRRAENTRFDSQNITFWDAERGEYRIYFREYRDRPTLKHCRAIRTAVSPDFVNWSEPEWLEYPGAPDEQLYTNQVIPYFRAPHLLVGFPTRYVERPWSPAIEALPELEHRRLRADISERYGAALTDGLFMSSRDGQTFKRWGEAFLRPGPQLQGNWAYGDNYQCWGLIETASDLCGAPAELSLFATENYWRTPCSSIRRYSLRLDGFVSLNVPLSGAEVVTRPLVFAGDHLELNFSTSAAGCVRVELQDADGRALPGFGLDDCYDVIGDELARKVCWKGGTYVSALAGRPVRIRFTLKDADLYAFRFGESK